MTGQVTLCPLRITCVARTVIPADAAACADVTLRSAFRLGPGSDVYVRGAYYLPILCDAPGADGAGNRCTVATITPVILMPMTVDRAHESLVTTDGVICPGL